MAGRPTRGGWSAQGPFLLAPHEGCIEGSVPHHLSHTPLFSHVRDLLDHCFGQPCPCPGADRAACEWGREVCDLPSGHPLLHGLLDMERCTNLNLYCARELLYRVHPFNLPCDVHRPHPHLWLPKMHAAVESHAHVYHPGVSQCRGMQRVLQH